MPPTVNERSKASKLRKRVAAGKSITDADRGWLSSYTTRQTIGNAKRAAAMPARPPTTVRGPQLAMTTHDAPPNPNAVHRTEVVADHIDPKENQWIPVAVDLPEGDAAPPGSAPPPKAGTPLVDETPPGSAPPPPTGDPAAAQQFAALITFITGLGINAAMEMVADAPIPDDVRAMLASDEAKGATLGTVFASAERLAMKWGMQAVPLGDEAVVAAALGGSLLCIVKNFQRKRLAKPKENTATAHANTDEPKAAKAPSAPKSALDSLWNGSNDGREFR